VSSHSCGRYLEDVTATTVPAQQPQASKNWPASLYRRPDGALEQDISPARMREILQTGEGELWVDIDSTNMHQLAPLEKVFEFHPLSIEDTLSPGIALPLIVIAGIFGMNFSQMPFTHDPYGFYGALAVMAVTSGVIMWWLKKNRWL
jgi:Mg2+ and Co2+ transporter CorA